MARAKNYKGQPVYNTRWGNRRQHMLAWYRKGNIPVLVASDTMDLFAKELKSRIRNNYQNIIVIEGGTGSGKSTAAIWLAKTMDPNWSITDNYIYSLDDLRNKLERAEKGEKVSPISLFDEAVVSLNSRNSNRTEDRDMVILFNTMRSRGWTTILCVPSIFDLNKAVRSTHVDYKLRCPDKSPIKGVPKRGFLEFSKAQRSEYKRTNEPYWYLFACGVYKALPPDWDKEYQKLKNEKQDLLLGAFIRKNTEDGEKVKKKKKKNEDSEEEYDEE